MLYFDEYDPEDLLNATVRIKSNELDGTIKGYAFYSHRDDHVLVCYTNDTGTVLDHWFAISDLDLVELAVD